VEPSESAGESEAGASAMPVSLRADALSAPEASGSDGRVESEPHATPMEKQRTNAARRKRPKRQADYRWKNGGTTLSSRTTCRAIGGMHIKRAAAAELVSATPTSNE
jgi:hypothetical protein